MRAGRGTEGDAVALDHVHRVVNNTYIFVVKSSNKTFGYGYEYISDYWNFFD